MNWRIPAMPVSHQIRRVRAAVEFWMVHWHTLRVLPRVATNPENDKSRGQGQFVITARRQHYRAIARNHVAEDMHRDAQQVNTIKGTPTITLT